jgi:hypothetical protein
MLNWLRLQPLDHLSHPNNQQAAFFGSYLRKRLTEISKFEELSCDLSFGSHGKEGMDIAYFMVVY